LARVAAEVRQARPEAIAISFLFCFANPQNEKRAAAASASFSSAIARACHPAEFREYERTSTVVVNAYLQPVMERYLER